jgi:hypothetical protein
MAGARSTISAAIALLLIGSAAQAMAEDAAGAALSGTAAAAGASPALDAKPRPWGIAERPRYIPRGWQCSPGLVWRNAGKTDWLCVDPAEADRVEQENEAAGDILASGSNEPDDCPPGLVRREAFRRDYVCVDPDRRDAVRQMNAALYTVR